MRLTSISSIVAVAALVGCSPPPPDGPAPPSIHKTEPGILGPSITFQSNGGSEPAELSVGCDGGFASSLQFKFDVVPPPAPLRGVFAEVRFAHEPMKRFELSQGVPQYWLVREGQNGDERATLIRLLAGEQLTLTLAPPWGSGRPVTWRAKPGLTVSGCVPPKQN